MNPDSKVQSKNWQKLRKHMEHTEHANANERIEATIRNARQRMRVPKKKKKKSNERRKEA